MILGVHHAITIKATEFKFLWVPLLFSMYASSCNILSVQWLLFRHDISASHADVLVKAIMESCISENYVDKHISNLKVCILSVISNKGCISSGL